MEESPHDEGLPCWRRDGYTVRLGVIARTVIYEDQVGRLSFTCDLYDGRWALDRGASADNHTTIIWEDDARIALARQRAQEFLSAQHQYYPNER
jgi:hypothetical protein